MPVERQQVNWHKPFCLDLHEETFTLLRIFLEKYTEAFYNNKLPAPFPTPEEHNRFVLLCLKLLSTHLSLAVSGAMNNNVLGTEAKALRTLLFRYTQSKLICTLKEMILHPFIDLQTGGCSDTYGY